MRGLVTLLIAACSGAAPIPAGDAAPITAAIYRDGDPRIERNPRSLHRPDGDVVSLAVTPRRPSVAMVVVRRAVDLQAGRGSIPLPEIGAAARPGSIWLRAPGLVVERIVRPPSIVEPRALRGRTVIARVGGERITGTIIDIDQEGALLERGDEVIVVPAQMLELEDGAPDPGPIRAEVTASRAGRFPLEIAYQTGSLAWTLDIHLAVSSRSTVEVTPVIAVQNRGAPLQGARVELFEGRYDDERRPARSIWSGRIDLGAGEIRRPLPSREVSGAVELRYRGFFGDRPEDRHLARWGTASTEIVEQVLRLPRGSLPAAAAVAHVEIDQPGGRRRHRVPIAAPPVEDAPIDLVLGAATELRGTRRQLWVKTSSDGSVITESYELAVLNRSDRTARVRVSEPLARSEDVELIERPGAARLVAGSLEIELAVGPQAREAVRYVARYRMKP